jgi:hypothetical protein
MDSAAWEDLLGKTRALAVGATEAYPDLFPDGLFGRRAEPRNTYLGLVMTRPEPNIFVLGANYYDSHDKGDNEDMYKVDTATLKITPYMRGTFENEYPEYAGHHPTPKHFLRQQFNTANFKL